MRAAATEGFATATDFADYLVRKGVPFRDAHEAVAQVVRYAESKGRELAALTLAELRQFAPRVDEDIQRALSLEGSVASRNHPGGTAPAQVRAAAQAARAALDAVPEQPRSKPTSQE
jgi:argininosuccinate lyase